VGTAVQSLAAYAGFVEHVFERHPVAKAVKMFYPRLEGVQVFKQIGSARVSEWKLQQDETLEQLVTEVPNTVDKSSFVFYSTRLGFTETVYVETAPTQVLDAADSVRWSLMTLSHELMHSHVRGLLATLFCGDLKRVLTVDSFLACYDEFRRFMEGGTTTAANPRMKLLPCLRYIIMNYCFQRDSFDNAARQASTDGNVNEELVMCARDEAREAMRNHFKLLDEILVHVLDAIYFYNGNLDLYLKLLWGSWETVPAVYEKIDHYILRTLTILAAIEGTGSISQRYTTAWQRTMRLFKGQKEEGRGSPLVEMVLNRLSERGASGFRYLAYPCIYLGACAYSFLCCHAIQKELRGGTDTRIADDGSYQLDTGGFSDSPIGNPVAFVADRLQRAVEGEETELSEEYRSAWLLLACASAGK
jgi:hypothetical protein